MAQCSCKKVNATGARTTVIMQEERCFGFLNAEVLDPSAYLGEPKKVAILSENLINEISTFQSNSLDPSRGVTSRQQGTSAVGGDVSAELVNNGLGWLMVQALGYVQGAGTVGDPYTILPVPAAGVASDENAGYQQTPGTYVAAPITYDTDCSDCPGYESGSYDVDGFSMEPSFTLFVSRDGKNIGDLNGDVPTDEMWFRYTGLRVNTWAISATATDISTTTFSLLGKEELVQDIPEPTAIEKPEINDPLSGFQGEIIIDDQAECILSFELSVNNNFSADQYCMGDRTRNSLPEGRREIEGTLVAELADLRFYNKYLNKTPAAVVVTWDLLPDTAPGTETLKIILPHIEFNGETPTAGGPEVINQNLPFGAVLTGSTEARALLTEPSYLAVDAKYDIAVEIVTGGTLV